MTYLLTTSHHPYSMQNVLRTTYWSGITLMVWMPRLAASWITALPTDDLASFWMITSPSDRVEKSARRRYARHEAPLMVAACSTGMSPEIFCTAEASATTFCDHVPEEDWTVCCCVIGIKDTVHNKSCDIHSILPIPARTGTTVSFTRRPDTSEPTLVTTPTPSLPQEPLRRPLTAARS